MSSRLAACAVGGMTLMSSRLAAIAAGGMSPRPTAIAGGGMSLHPVASATEEMQAHYDTAIMDLSLALGGERYKHYKHCITLRSRQQPSLCVCRWESSRTKRKHKRLQRRWKARRLSTGSSRTVLTI